MFLILTNLNVRADFKSMIDVGPRPAVVERQLLSKIGVRLS